ncbi:MAG: peptidoglycan DD-metalloendopeptidase family protein, partial [Parcubacteria group bacterium]|nr:peptidoglycan DD-metalloendopeptidase family protein [Parcubacteria group bacterium]
MSYRKWKLSLLGDGSKKVRPTSFLTGSKSKYQIKPKAESSKPFWHFGFGFDLTFELWHSSFSFLCTVSLVILLMLTMLWPLTGQGAPTDDLRQQIEAKSKEIQRLEEEARKYQAEIKVNQKEQNTLANQIAQIANRIAKLSLDIRLTEAKIAKTEFQIEQIAFEIDRRVEEIESEKRTLAQAIRVLSAYDGEARFMALLKNPTLASFLDQVQYVSNLQGEIQRKLENVKLLKASLEEEKSDLETKRNELGDLREQFDAQRQLSREQRNERELLLKQTRNQEARYQTLLKDVRKRQLEIQQEIVDLEEKLRRAIDPSGVPGARPGVLAWPLEGVLSQGYGPTSATGFINDGYQFHNGVDIAASFGSPVRAARDGTVVGVGDLGRWAYGRWVAVEHDNGLTTLYAHLSLAAARLGQVVRRGDIIGYEGSTGFSTGPHLHFTVYASS